MAQGLNRPAATPSTDGNTYCSTTSQFIASSSQLRLQPQLYKPPILHRRVNVSPRHALQGDLAASVEQALASTGFDAGSLLVELTESERIDDVEGLANVLCAVRKLGVSVALDDFGTGWSTLGLLRRVPFDALKIDRSFTAGLPSSRSDRALVASIVTLARSLGVPAGAGKSYPE